MVVWNLAYSKYAIKDAKKLSAAGLKDKAQALLDILEVDPLQNPPPYEKLVGDLRGLTHAELIFNTAWFMKSFAKKRRFES